MPRKRKSKCLFVDNEAAEEDDEGNIVRNSDDEEEDEDRYESDFVDDEEEVIVRREKVKLDADEYEIDEDDWLLLQDNARANRVSRITRAESSDSDDSDFIDDDGASVVVPFEKVAVDPPEELFYDEEDVLNTLIELSKESESYEEMKQPEIAEPSPPASPLPISMYVSLEENVKRIGGPSWADFKFNQSPQNTRNVKKKTTPPSKAQPNTTKKRTPPSKAPPKLEPGIIRNSDGVFLVTNSGKRIRMTEEGSVKL